MKHELPLLCEDRAQDPWQAWAHAAGVALHNPRRTVDDANVRAQAAIDGQGLMLADELMRNEMRSGALLAPFDVELGGYGYVVTSSPRRALSDAARAALLALRAGPGGRRARCVPAAPVQRGGAVCRRRAAARRPRGRGAGALRSSATSRDVAARRSHGSQRLSST